MPPIADTPFSKCAEPHVKWVWSGTAPKAASNVKVHSLAKSGHAGVAAVTKNSCRSHNPVSARTERWAELRCLRPGMARSSAAGEPVKHRHAPQRLARPSGARASDG